MDVAHTSGRRVLDLVGTVADRGTADEEHLRSWTDVEHWLHGAGLDVDDLEGDETALHRVRALRDALYRVVAARLAGRMPSDADRLAVNRAAALGGLTPSLTEAGELRWTGGLDGVLAALAADGLDLLGSPEMAGVRECADARCTRLFVDRSHGRRRRWCGMKGCGDRAKAAAYRRRQRGRAQ